MPVFALNLFDVSEEIKSKLLHQLEKLSVQLRVGKVSNLELSRNVTVKDIGHMVVQHH